MKSSLVKPLDIWGAGTDGLEVCGQPDGWPAERPYGAIRCSRASFGGPCGRLRVLPPALWAGVGRRFAGLAWLRRPAKRGDLFLGLLGNLL